MEHEAVVHAHAEPEDAWNLLVDVEGWPRWTASVARAQLITRPPLAVGSRVRVHQPRLVPMTWTVTELDEPRRFAWQASAPGIRIMADHVLSPRRDGTTTIRLSVEHRGVVAWLIRPLTARITDRYLHTEAAGLKRAAELVAQGRGQTSAAAE